MNYEFEKKETEARIEQEKKDAIAAVESKRQKMVIVVISIALVFLLALSIVIYNSLKQNKKKNLIITEQKEIIEKEKHLVELKQKEILDSIRYAKRIQSSLLPSEKFISRIIGK